MSVLTPEFLDKAIQAGPLTQARQRKERGTANPKNKADWRKLTSWGLVCEELLDTVHPDWWLDDVIAELERRGFTSNQIDLMRKFAWQTAGWLNYDKMHWEWVHLDESDIEIALKWMLKDGIIDQQQYRAGLGYLTDPRSIGNFATNGTKP